MHINTCVICDFAPLRDLLETILKGEGHEVLGCSDLTECSSLQRKGTDNLCTLMILEYLDERGLDLVRRAIKEGRLPPENIAALAFPNDDGVVELHRMGCHIISQPFRISEILEWIRAREKTIEERLSRTKKP